MASITEAEAYCAQQIAALAYDRLAQSPYRTIKRVSCQVHGRVLTLHGQLPSFYENQLAQEAVAGLDGVEQVVNQIEVVPAAPRPGYDPWA